MSLSAHAELATEHGSRYLVQLSKHWSHKLPVVFDDQQSRIDLPLGPCILTAGPGSLAILVQAEDEPALATLKDVVARHLERFAFREELKVAWG
jgi:hypothetical protein